MSDTGRPLPKFGEWDVNDPASAEGFTVIFNKARDEKKTGGKPESPGKVDDSHVKSGVNPAKPQAVSFNFITQPRIFFCNSAEKMVLLYPKSSCGLLTVPFPRQSFKRSVCSSICSPTMYLPKKIGAVEG